MVYGQNGTDKMVYGQNGTDKILQIKSSFNPAPIDQRYLSLYPGSADTPHPKLGWKVFWVLGGEELKI